MADCGLPTLAISPARQALLIPTNINSDTRPRLGDHRVCHSLGVANTGHLRGGTSVAGVESGGPVAEFCAGLARLQQRSGLDRAMLARRVGYSRSQLYEILDGRIRRPPEWDRLVEPLVRTCTGDDERAVAAWRRRHDVLVAVYTELTCHDRQDRPEGTARPAEARVGIARVVPAQLPADVDVFTGRAAELAELDRLLTTTPTRTDATAADGGGSTAVVISAVSGTAGVGKTALRRAHMALCGLVSGPSGGDDPWQRQRWPRRDQSRTCSWDVCRLPT